jgi:hypothetical protein
MVAVEGLAENLIPLPAATSKSSVFKMETSLRNVRKFFFSSSKMVVQWPLAMSFTTTR